MRTCPGGVLRFGGYLARRIDPLYTGEHVDCLLDELDVSDSVRQRMESAQLPDGGEESELEWDWDEAEWDGITAHCTYDEDSGLDIALYDEDGRDHFVYDE